MCERAEVGENAGTLDVALERVADFKERSAAFRNRLGTALLYPAVVLTMALGVSVLLMTVVVPNLLTTIQDSGRPLPVPTRIVKAASDWLVGYWWLLLLSLAAVVIAARMILRTTRGKLLWHRFLLRIPIAGELSRKQAIVRVCVVLSTLLRSGLVFVRSVQIARQTLRTWCWPGAGAMRAGGADRPRYRRGDAGNRRVPPAGRAGLCGGATIGENGRNA